jgi:hypothetical protein
MPGSYTTAATSPTSPTGAFPGSTGVNNTYGLSTAQSQMVVRGTGTQGAANDAMDRGGVATTVSPDQTVAQVLDSFAQLATADPTAYASIQQDVYDAGLMGDTVYRNGGANISYNDVFQAYKKAVLGAAASGEDLHTYLAGKAADFTAVGGAKSKLPMQKIPVSLTNPEDVAAVGNGVAKTLLGRNLTDAEVQAITAVLHGQETQAGMVHQANQYAADQATLGNNGMTGTTPGGATTGTTGGPQLIVEQPAPSAQAAAENFVKTADVSEYDATRGAGIADGILKAILSGAPSGAAKPPAEGQVTPA